jgi:hypothetical protein
MAITKESNIDKIEIVGDYKHIQVRKRTDIIENDEVISSSFERYMVMPTQNTSDLPKEIQDIAKIVHTQKVKDAYIEHSKTRQEG